jgi:hypothetical protein
MCSGRVAAFVFSLTMFVACASHPRVERSPAGIAVDPEVLSAAKEGRFDYMKQLTRAERGDQAALIALIELSPRIAHSAAGSEQHGDILLALRERVGVATFREAMARSSANAQHDAALTLEVAEENKRLQNDL